MARLGPVLVTCLSSLPRTTLLDIGPTSWGFVQLFRNTGLRGAALAAALLAAGCSTPNVGTDVAMTGMPNAEVALRDSMRLVDAEMVKLGVMAPTPRGRSEAPVVPGELQKLVTFDWSGSLEDGVRKLAGNVGYAVAVEPPPPGKASVQVAVATGAVPIINAFQALGVAAGARAMVRVDPARRQVDVVYRA